MIKFLIALIAGVVNVFGFAPFAWWPLSLLSFAVLFALWMKSSRGDAALQGFAFGIGMFGVGTSWMYVSVHTYGGMPAPLAAFCILVLVLVVALYPALAGYAQGIFRKRHPGARAILIMPCMCAAVEAVRAWAFSGFPWLASGYAMLDTPLAGLAPFGGLHLMTLLMLMSAGAIYALVVDWTRAHILLAVLPAAAWFGGWQLQDFEMTYADGEEISVALVQNNIALTRKWDAAHSRRILDDYVRVSETARDADVVVWPEAAVADYFDQVPRETLAQLRAHPADFLFGTVTRRSNAGGRAYYNSIVALDNESEYFYHKQHLVPFGEYVPFADALRPLLARMQIPMSDFSAWRAPQSTLPAAGVNFAASICYEDAFPEQWRAQVAAAGALINLNEDAWFGDSLAPHQRLQMARFRALESGRPMLRASNNGLSAVIDWRGRVVQVAPQFTRAVVRAEVQPRAGATMFTVHGNLPAFLAMALFGVCAVLFTRRKR